MYRAKSSPAAWNTGNARSTSVASLSAAPSGSSLAAEYALLDPPAELGDAIPCRDGALGERFGAPQRVAGPAPPGQRVDELALEGQVELGRRDEGGGALEQAYGGGVVLAEEPRGGRRP